MKRHASLRVRLLLLLLVAVLPLLGASVYRALEDEKATLARASAALQISADLGAARQARLVESARQLLIALASSADVRSGNPGICQRYLEQLRQTIQSYNNFGVLGLDGVLRCDARKRAPGVVQIPLSSQTPLELAVQTREFAVGQYQIGTLTGIPVLAFGYPVADATGDIDAVAFASVRLDSLQQALRELPVPESGTVVLLDRNARVLASSDPEFPIGTKLADATQPQAERPDIRSIAVMPGYGGGALSVLVRARREALVRSGRERLLHELEALALLALLGAAMAWTYAGRTIVAPTRQILRFTSSLREGSLDSRIPASGMRAEFADIAGGLNQMAHDLQQRTDALRDAASASAQVLATRDLILDTMQEGVIAVDNARNFILFNRAARRLFGDIEASGAERSMQVPVLAGVCHPSTGLPLQLEELPLFMALLGGSGRDLDLLVRNEHVPQGRLLRCTYGPIVGPHGILGALGVLSDITEQHKSEEARSRSDAELRETQRKLLEAQRIGRIGSWQSNEVTRSFWFSEEVYELLGVEQQNFDKSYRALVSLVHPEDRKGLRALTDAVGLHGKLDHEFRLLTPAGQLRWLHVRGEPRGTGQDAQLFELAGVIQDITARKQDEAMRAAAEQAVRDNLDMLSRLVRLQAAVADADFSVDLLLDRLATMALEVTQAPGAEFELLDGPELVLRSSSGVAVRPVGMRRMPAQLSREAARHGRNLLCMDAQADPRVDAQWCLRYGVRSLAGTTIQLNGAAIGTLVVVSPEVAAFTDVHASVLQLLGEFLGGLLHRRHAQDEAEGHLLMLERAADAAQRVVAHTSLQDGLREAAAQLRRVIPASHCLISLVAHDAAPEAGQVTLRAYDPVGQDMALDSRAADAVALDINARETSAIARAVQQTGRPMRLDRAGLLAQTGSPDQHAGPGKQGNGWLGVPLVGRDGAKLGLAQLWDKESGEFSLRDEYVAIEMAQLISVAIENARLFEAIHELNQSLERKVVERSRELARQEAVFHTVADHAPQIMWIVDSKGAVTWLNRYWYELVGGEPPRWQGREWMQAVHPDDVAQMLERWVV